jgi:hypothetical protein
MGEIRRILRLFVIQRQRVLGCRFGNSRETQEGEDACMQE